MDDEKVFDENKLPEVLRTTHGHKIPKIIIELDESSASEYVELLPQNPEPILNKKEKRKSKHFLHVPDCLKSDDDDDSKHKYENK